MNFISLGSGSSGNCYLLQSGETSILLDAGISARSMKKVFKDYDMSPAAESLDKIIARFEQPWTTYFFIEAEGEDVGAIRVVDKKDGSRKRISPLWIMEEYRGKGYAQDAIRAVEALYGEHHWELDTILQEEGNLHLYEKMGYHRTGKTDRINERMDIVYYEKD